MQEGKKPGLWDNIHAKRKRIKSGSGESMRKPGSKGAPSKQDFKDASESTVEYGKSQEKIRDRQKNDNISSSDKSKLKKLSDMMKNANKVNEAIQASDYNTGHEKSAKGYRPKVTHKEKGTAMYLGSTSYKTKDHAKGHADAYLKGYAKRGPNHADDMVHSYKKSNRDHINEDVKEGAFSRMDAQRKERERLGKNKVKGSGLDTYKKKTSEPKRSLSRMEDLEKDGPKRSYQFRVPTSKAAMDYSAKKAAVRKAMNQKNDPGAAKKGYALSVTDKAKAAKKRREHMAKNESTTYNVNVAGEGGTRVKAKTPKHAASKAFKNMGIAQRHRSNIKHTVTPHKEEVQVDEYITGKQIRMAKGIANDPRHKGGDHTGASKKMEKIKKGLSNHPAVAKALKKANEEKESILSFMEVAGQRGRPKKGEMAQSDQHIIMQLRSAQDMHRMGGDKHITFSGGQKAKVKPHHVNAILQAHDKLNPMAKRKLRAAIGRNPQGLTKVGTMLTKKR